MATARRPDAFDDGWSDDAGWAAAPPGRRWARVAVGVLLAAALVAAGALVWRRSATPPGADRREYRLGEQADLQVKFLQGGDDGLLGVTPVALRVGRTGDYAGWERQRDAETALSGTPHYVDVRLANKGAVDLAAFVGLHLYDDRDREVTRVELSRPGEPDARFPPCPGYLVGRDRIAPGDSASTCVVFDVAAGVTLERIEAGEPAAAAWSVR